MTDARDTSGTAGPGRLAWHGLLVAVGFFVTGTISLNLQIDASTIVPVWLASGVALAGVLAWGRWMLLAGMLGNVALSLVVADLPLLPAIGIAIGDGIEVLAAAWIMTSLAGTVSFSQARCVLALAIAAPISSAVGASVAITILESRGELVLDPEPAWLRYWLSTITGMVLVAPLLMSWFGEPRPRYSMRRLVEIAVLALVLAALTWSLFARTESNFLDLLFILPLFAWAVVRFGTRGAAGCSALFAIILGYGAIDRGYQLSGLGLTGTADAIQVLLVILAIANLALAASLTERHDVSAELRDLLDTFDQSQRIAHVGSWELRLDGSRLIWCSDELCRMLPLQPDDQRRVTVEAMLATVEGLDRQRLARAVERAITARTPFEMDHRVADGGGRVLRHVADFVPAPNGADRDARIVGSVVDVTDERRMQSFQDDLIATASHELRTPLTSIIGFADTLLDGWGSLAEDRRHEFVGIIATQAHRLERIVEDTLLQSKVDANAVLPNVRPFLVGRGVRRIVESLNLYDAELEITPGLLALGDAEQFEQVLDNLLSNAAKYGRPPIAVRARELDDGRVELRVEDHGPGIPPSFGQRAFERFARGPDVGTAPGTGLGLSIVRGLVEAVGGTVHHERWEGVTTFVVRLPSGRDPEHSGPLPSIGIDDVLDEHVATEQRHEA